METENNENDYIWAKVLGLNEITEIAEKDSVEVEVELDDGRITNIVLVKDSSQESGWIAYENKCSHDSENLNDADIDFENHTIQCPRHGAKFDLETGDPLCMPAITPINVFAVKEAEDGYLYLMVPNKI
ncbi:MAG: Rieske (2Fe-2S) protein [Spirochaetia bacterium]|nr:Rieske (2Fe-2S) protein [Spirochaetia bacterium]